VKQIALEGEEKKAGIQYYLEAKDEIERKKWLAKPFENVPEGMLPAIKASFLCYSQANRDELMKLLHKRIVQASARLDPTLDNHVAVLDEFIKKARASPEKDFLLFCVYACHGYHADGFQEVLGPYFNNETQSLEFIPVENYVRGRLRDLPNAYCVIHFASCREIKKISDLEVERLKE
jgi:hypothetical protein